MGTNSETKSSFDISLFLKRFHNPGQNFSIHKKFNQRQKETEIEIKVLDATLVVYLIKGIRPNSLKS